MSGIHARNLAWGGDEILTATLLSFVFFPLFSRINLGIFLGGGGGILYGGIPQKATPDVETPSLVGTLCCVSNDKNRDKATPP